MCCEVQAALVICGFVICGFDYPQLSNCIQNLLFADDSPGYLRFFQFLSPKKGIKPPKQRSLATRGFGIRPIYAGRIPANNDGRLH